LQTHRTGDISNISPHSINILGEFNLAGETWILRDYYKRMGIEVVSCLTGDSRIEDIRRSHGAKLNLVQCSGSMTSLAKMMERDYGIPFKRVSYFGIEDMSAALYDAAKFFKDDPEIMTRAQNLVRAEVAAIYPELLRFKKKLAGKKAAIYVGGSFKAFSLMRALRLIGMETAIVGSQTGDKDDYQQLQEMADPGTIIVDDSNPLELAKFCLEKDVDLFIGGVKERPIAYKLGIGFCDHNHERKEPLAGYIGMLNFAKEVYSSVASPVWQFAPRRATRASTPDPAPGAAVAHSCRTSTKIEFHPGRSRILLTSPLNRAFLIWILRGDNVSRRTSQFSYRLHKCGQLKQKLHRCRRLAGFISSAGKGGPSKTRFSMFF